VILDAGSGGTNGNATATFDSATLTSYTPATKTGYVLAGYFTADSGGTQVIDSAGALIADVSGFTDGAGKWTKIDPTIILYAHWTPGTTTVILDAGSGGTDGFAKATFDSATLTDYTPATKTGYVLTGYFTTDTGGTKVIDNTGKLVAGVSDYTDADGKWTNTSPTTTLFAHWQAVEYKLTLDPPSLDFGEIKAGSAPSTHTLTLTNAGNSTLSGINIFLEGKDPKAFVLTVGAPSVLDIASADALVTPALITPASIDSHQTLTTLAAYSLAPGEYITINAAPESGLSARQEPYTATLRITTTEGTDLSAPLSFKVDAASSGGSSNSTTPQTGDGQGPALLGIALVLTLISMAAFALALVLRRGFGRKV
jgi:hypothetical protein